MNQRYDDAADDYIALFGDDVTDPATAAALDLLGDVVDHRVLDAPCGNGRVARELIRRGARAVVASDLSSVMLQRALATGDNSGIDYRNGDLTDPDFLGADRFDAIVCNYGINEIDDIDAALKSLHRLVVPGGAVVVSMLHPAFPGIANVTPASWSPGQGYYREGRWFPQSQDVRQSLGTNHRKLSTYLNAITAAGLGMERFEEPEPPYEFPGQDPVPMFLVLRCRRPSA